MKSKFDWCVRHWKMLAVMSLWGIAYYAAVGWLSYTWDQKKAEIERGLEISTQCSRLRLRMSREEILSVMGPPLKEYGVRAAGKGSEVVFKEMLFSMPLAKKLPYVDLDLDTLTAVEIYCSDSYHASLPFNAAENAVPARPLPSDRTSP